MPGVPCILLICAESHCISSLILWQIPILWVDMKTNCRCSHQDVPVVKALDLRSNGQVSAWVRTPLPVELFLSADSHLSDLFLENVSSLSKIGKQSSVQFVLNFFYLI